MFIVEYTGKDVENSDKEKVQNLIVGKEYIVESTHVFSETFYNISQEDLIPSRYFEKLENQEDITIILNMVKSLSDKVLDEAYERKESCHEILKPEKILDSILETIPECVLLYEMSRRTRIRSVISDVEYENSDYSIKKLPVISTVKYEILKQGNVVGIMEVLGDDVKYIPKPDFIEKKLLEIITNSIKYSVSQE